PAPGCPHCRAAEAGRCCQEAAEEPCCEADDTTSPALRWVIGASALRCRGLSPVWDTAAPSLPPPAPVPWNPPLAPDGWVTCGGDDALLVPRTPAVPPPRQTTR